MVQILDRKVKQVRNKTIHLIKVQWRSQHVEEDTWEPEKEMWKTYPHLFQGMSSFRDETLIRRVEL